MGRAATARNCAWPITSIPTGPSALIVARAGLRSAMATTSNARQAWFAAYRERIRRAPVVMTIPAMLFFVAPFLTLIMFLVFTPLVRALGQL